MPAAPVTPEIFEDPYAAMEAGAGADFMGVPLSPSAWWLIPFWVVVWVGIAVIGEEVVWRGYPLPKQEEAFGRWAWLINGLLTVAW